MKFEINFNNHKKENDKVLEQLGAVLIPTGSTKYPPFEFYQIELNTFEELQILLNKVDKLTGKTYHSAIVSFDNPTIFLDANV